MLTGTLVPVDLTFIDKGSDKMKLETVVEEYEMIDIINGYLDSKSGKPIILGGIAGTSLFEHVFNACMSVSSYNKICVVEGIQDIIGMKVQNTNHWNHYFYAELFTNGFMQNQPDRSSFESFMKDYKKIIKVPMIMTERVIHSFDIIIVNDAHLIPDEYLNQIKVLRKKIFILVDPFDINGERYFDVPTVVDSLKRLPLLIARARALYDVESRAYDKTMQSTIDTGKISKRSIGKLGEQMFVSKDPNIIQYARNKQYVTPSKKNHRMMVMDNHVIRTITPSTDIHSVVTKYSLVHAIAYSKQTKLFAFKIYASTREILATMSYDINDITSVLHVIPANILTPELVQHHRFKHLTYVAGDMSLSVREMYTLMKCTKNLLIAE